MEEVGRRGPSREAARELALGVLATLTITGILPTAAGWALLQALGLA